MQKIPGLAARISDGSLMSDVLLRLAAPDEFEAIGELREAAYSHDYEISDNYRATLLDVTARGDEQRSGWLSTGTRVSSSAL
jgi:hypothetical protein